MKKITLLLALLLATFSLTFAGINMATAWWNAETFDSYTLGQPITYETGYDWTGTIPVIHTNAKTSVTTAGNVLGFSPSTATDLTEGSSSQHINTTKVFPNALSGIIYAKMSAFHCIRGTGYVFKNTEGKTVFGFGSKDSNSSSKSNLRYTLDGFIYGSGYLNGDPTLVEVTSLNWLRSQWYDWEMVIDLDTKKLIKLIATNTDGETVTLSDISLTNGGSVDKLNIATGAYTAAGLDNVTIGQLKADNIKTLDGVTSLQTLSSGNVTSDFNVTAFTTAMGLDLSMAQPDLDVTWSILDYGTLSVADQALVSLTRNSSDFTKATLSAGNISADGTVTLKAVYGTTELTQQVLLKSLTIEGLKSGLADEIVIANALMTAVTDDNPYIAGLKSALTSSVNAAQAVIDNGSATIENATTAMSNLQTAEASFTTSMTPYNDFVTYIGNVQTAYDAETRTATFITTVKGTLNTALTAAATARTTISVSGDITAAKTTLETAYNQFVADIPTYASLETQIATVDARLTVATPRTGEGTFLMFTTASVSTLNAAKDDAVDVLTNGTTATSLSTAQTDLATALTTFNETPRVAPSTTDYYRIYTYGVDAGDGDGVKKVLYIDGAVDGLGGTLKYTEEGNTTEFTDKFWKITEVSTGKFNLKSKLSSTYLSDRTLADVAAEFSLLENASQGGSVSVDEGFFLYSMLNKSANKYLEVDTYDGTALNGVFYNNSATATRLRFCYQFESISLGTGLNNAANSNIKVYMANNKAVIDGINAGETYTVYNALGAVVLSAKATSSKVSVNLPSAGLYMIKTLDGTFKLIK
ncbi:MAG: hypothetical protein PHS59_08160 [Paludibacter sp.]|nr:hypothetical protein [Paludibacter sp.]